MDLPENEIDMVFVGYTKCQNHWHIQTCHTLILSQLILEG